MLKGLLVMKRDDVKDEAIFIEQDVVEFARQNALTTKRRAENERKQMEADSQRRKAEKEAEKAAARRRAYNVATVKYLLIRLAFSGLMAWGWVAGLIHPLVSAALILICMCTACERLGRWRARNRKKEDK